MSLPSQPGVYWFISEKNKILYVGKAKNLKNRVSSYKRVTQLNQRITEMVTTATAVKFTVLESELEALLIEAELIRLHQPPYNILLKDDKTPLYIHITKDTYPQVLTIRKKEIDTKRVGPGTTLGPFPSGYKVKEVLKIIRPIFGWCNQRGSNKQTTKACFYHHLDLCSGACIGEVSREDYIQNIKDLTLFLKGEKKSVIKQMKTRMLAEAEEHNFEKAQKIKHAIQLIESVTNQSYKLKPNMTLPQLKDSRSQEGLLYLQKLLSQHGLLPRKLTINRIEGYDVSNTQGTDASVAMVVFEQGKPAKEEYRLFNIRTLNTPNDYHMMKEALLRRQNHPEWGDPDLVVIDGGKGQLRAALSVWQQPNPVISIAKRPDRIIVPLITHKKNKKQQKVEYAVHSFPDNHPLLQLIQQVRDESHRFSKKQHKRRQLKTMFE